MDKRVFTHCITYRFSTTKTLTFFCHIGSLVPVKCQNVLQAAVMQKIFPHLLSSSLLELNLERKSFFMRVRGVGIKGWIIFQEEKK